MAGKGNGIASSFGNYFKNVARSTAYLARDVIDAELPEIADIADLTANAISTTVDTIRHFDTFSQKVVQGVKTSKAGRDVGNILKNTVKDIKTGNFYRGDRMDGEDSFGSNLSFQANMFQKSSNVSANLAKAQIMNDDKNSNIDRVIWSKQHAESQKMSLTINNNIANIIGTLNEKMLPFMEHATNYMDETVDIQSNILGALEDLTDTIMTQYNNGYDNNRQYESKNNFSQIFNYDGSFKYGDVFNKVKDNVMKHYIEPFMGNFMDFEGNSILTEISKNPIGFLAKTVLTNSIPYELQSSIYNFRTALGGASSGLFNKLKTIAGKEENKDKWLYDLFNKVTDGFGKVKDKIETNKYEKGPMPFDGVTRKAITHVIPTLLSKIYSALIGVSDELVVNYNTGEFAWGKDVKKAIDSSISAAGNEEFHDIQTKMNEILDNVVRNNKEALPAEIADVLKGKFGEIFEYIKKDDEFFNFNDPKYAAKLEERFGSAATRFLDIISSPLFTKNERIAIQARKVNAKATQDKATNAAEANAELSGYGQYQNSQRANLVDSGYSVELSAAQKASEKRHNLRILEDKERQLRLEGADAHVFNDITKLRNDIEEEKKVNMNGYYFMKDHYMRELKERQRLRTYDKHNTAAEAAQTRKLKEIERTSSSKAEAAVVKRDNMFLTSLNNIYQRLVNGIIVFPREGTVDTNGGNVLDPKGSPSAPILNVEDIVIKRSETAEMTDKEVNNKIDNAERIKNAAPAKKIKFDNNEMIDNKELLKILSDNGLMQDSFGNLPLLRILKSKFPNSNLVYVLDLLNTLGVSDGEKIRNFFNKPLIKTIFGSTIGEQNLQNFSESIIKALTTVDEKVLSEVDLYKKISESIMGSEDKKGVNSKLLKTLFTFVDDNVFDMSADDRKIYSQLADVYGLDGDAVNRTLLFLNEFRKGGHSFKEKDVDKIIAHDPDKTEVDYKTYDKLMKQIKDIPLLGNFIPKEIEESKDLEKLYEYTAIAQSDTPVEALRKFMDKYGYKQDALNAATDLDLMANLLKTKLEEKGLGGLSKLGEEIYKISPLAVFKRNLDQIAADEPEKKEEEYIYDELDYYLGEKISKEGLNFIRKNIIGRRKNEISKTVDSTFVRSYFNDIPENKNIEKVDVITALGSKLSSEFDAEQFRKEYMAISRAGVYKKVSNGKILGPEDLTEEMIDQLDFTKLDLSRAYDANELGLKNDALNSFFNDKKNNLLYSFMEKFIPFPEISETIGEVLGAASFDVTKKLDELSDSMYRLIYGDQYRESDISDGFAKKMQEMYETAPKNVVVEQRGLGSTISDIMKKAKSGELKDELIDRFSNGFGFVTDFFKSDDFKKGSKESIFGALKEIKNTLKMGADTAYGTAKYVNNTHVSRNTRRYGREFRDTFLGGSDREFDFKEFGNKATGKVQEYAPHFGKGLKGAALTGLAGILLPGPALAYATIGGLATMAKQTGDLNKFLYGWDGKDGNRRKGVMDRLPQAWQKAIKKEKIFTPKAMGKMIGGASVGALATTAWALGSNYGLLPKFFMPGGLLGGALLGAGIGLVKNSEGLKQILFGEKDLFGQRKGGIIPKPLIKKFPAMARWSSLGILASYFLPGGPVLGAILGTIGGALGDTKSFKRFLWGNYDPDSKFGSKGLLGETFDIVQRRIINPFLGNMKKSFKMTKLIKDTYMSPINNEIKNMFVGVGSLIKAWTQDMMASATKKIKKTKTGGKLARVIETIAWPITALGTKFPHLLTGAGNLALRGILGTVGRINDVIDTQIIKIASKGNLKNGQEMMEKALARKQNRAEARENYKKSRKEIRQDYKRDKKVRHMEDFEAYTRTFGNFFTNRLFNKRHKEEEKLVKKDPRLKEYREGIEYLKNKQRTDYFDPNDSRYWLIPFNWMARRKAQKYTETPEGYAEYIQRRNDVQPEIERLQAEYDKVESQIRKDSQERLDADQRKRVGKRKARVERLIGDTTKYFEYEDQYKKTSPEYLKNLQKKIKNLQEFSIEDTKDVQEAKQKLANYDDPKYKKELEDYINAYKQFSDPTERDKAIQAMKNIAEDDDYRNNLLEQLDSYRDPSKLEEAINAIPEKLSQLSEDDVLGRQELEKQKAQLERYKDTDYLNKSIDEIRKIAWTPDYLKSKIEEVVNYNSEGNRKKYRKAKKELARLNDPEEREKLLSNLDKTKNKRQSKKEEELAQLEELYKKYSDPEYRKDLENKMAEEGSKAGKGKIRKLNKKLSKTSDSYIKGLKDQINQMRLDGVPETDKKYKKLMDEYVKVSDPKYRKRILEDLEYEKNKIKAWLGYDIMRDQDEDPYSFRSILPEEWKNRAAGPEADGSWTKIFEPKSKDNKDKKGPSTGDVINEAVEVAKDFVESNKEEIEKTNLQKMIDSVKTAFESVKSEFPASEKEVDVAISEAQTTATTSALVQVEDTIRETVTHVADRIDTLITEVQNLRPKPNEPAAPKPDNNVDEATNNKSDNSDEGNLSGAVENDVTEDVFNRPDDNGKDTPDNLLGLEDDDEDDYNNYDMMPKVVKQERAEDLAMEVRNIDGTVVDKADGMSMQEQVAVKNQKDIGTHLEAIAKNTGDISKNTDELEGLMGVTEKTNELWEWLKEKLFGGGDDKDGGIGDALPDWLLPSAAGAGGATLFQKIFGGLKSFGAGALKFAKGALPVIAFANIGYNLYKGATAETPEESYEYYSEAADRATNPATAKTVANIFAKHGDDIAKCLTNAFSTLEKLFPALADDIYKAFSFIIDNTDDILKRCNGLSQKIAKFFKGVATGAFVYDIQEGFCNAERYLQAYDYVPEDLERIVLTIVHVLNNSFLFGLLDESWLVPKILKFLGYDTEALEKAQQEYTEMQQGTGFGENKFQNLADPTLLQTVGNWFTNNNEKEVLGRYNAETMLAAYYTSIGNTEEAAAATDRMNRIAEFAKAYDYDLEKADMYVFEGRDYLVDNNILDATNAGSYALALAKNYGSDLYGSHAELFDNIDAVTNKAMVDSSDGELDVNGVLPAQALVNAVENGNYNPEMETVGIEGLSNFYNSILSIDGKAVVKPDWLVAYEQYCAAYGITPDKIETKGIDSNFAEDWIDGKINADNLHNVIIRGEYKINGKKTKKYLKDSDFETREELVESNQAQIDNVIAYNEEMSKYSTQDYVNQALNGDGVTTSQVVDDNISQVVDNRVIPLTKEEELGLEEAGYSDYHLQAFESGDYVGSDFKYSPIGEFAAYLRSKNYDMPEWWEAYRVYAAHYGLYDDEDITKMDIDWYKDYKAGKIDPYNLDSVYDKYYINGKWGPQLRNEGDGKTAWYDNLGESFHYSSTTHTDLDAKHGAQQDVILDAFSNKFGANATPSDADSIEAPTGESVPAIAEIDAIDQATDMPDMGGYVDEFERLGTGLTDGYSEEMERMATEFTGGTTQFFTDYQTGLTDYYDGMLTKLTDTTDQALSTPLPTKSEPSATLSGGQETEMSSLLSLTGSLLTDASNLAVPYASGGYIDKYEPKQTEPRVIEKPVYREKEKPVVDYRKLKDSFGGALDEYYKKAHAKDNIKRGIGGIYDSNITRPSATKPVVNTMPYGNTNANKGYNAPTTTTSYPTVKLPTVYNNSEYYMTYDKDSTLGTTYNQAVNNNVNQTTNKDNNNQSSSTLKKGTWELPLDKEGHSYGQTTSKYGWRAWDGIFHNGIDIDTGTGDPVYSIWPGKVRFAQKGWNGGYGSTIWVDHDNGLSTLYGHQHEIHVKEGDQVKAGQQIGESGGKPSIDGTQNAGHSSGDHLHLTLFTKHGTTWASKEGGPHVDNEFLWNPEAKIPDEIADIVANTTYKADGSSSTTNTSPVNGVDGSGDGSSATNETSPTGNKFADAISKITSILQSTVLGEAWVDPTVSTSSPSSSGNGTVPSDSSSIDVKYNGKLGDVDLVDFADLGWKESFLERIQKGAISNYLDGGVLPSLTMAQAIGESDWGRSGLTQQGNALFGIKAGPNWTGKTWSGSTIEYFDGTNASQIQDNFRAYDSWDESIADHGRLMMTDRYTKTRQATTIEDAAREVKAAQYATDPGYTSFLLDLARDNNLRAVDAAAVGHRGGADPSASSTPVASAVSAAANTATKAAPGGGKKILKSLGRAAWEKAKQKGKQLWQHSWDNLKSEIKAKQQEQQQFRKNRGKGGFISDLADSAIDTAVSSFTDPLKEKQEEQKEFRNKGMGGYTGDRGGFFSNLVNKATNVVKNVVEKFKGNKTTKNTTKNTTTTTNTSGNTTDDALPNTQVIEKIITEMQPSKFKDNGVADGAYTVTSLGNKTDSPSQVIEDNYKMYKSKIGKIKNDNESKLVAGQGGYVGATPKNSNNISGATVTTLQNKLRTAQLKVGTQKGAIGGLVDDLYSNAKRIAEDNKRRTIETNNTIKETNRNTEKRLSEIKKQQELNNLSAENLLKDSMDKVKNTVSTYQNDISNTINSTMNADAFMKSNSEDSNWDQLLALMQDLCNSNNEIASNTSNIDKNASNLIDSIGNAKSNVNITNNTVENMNNNDKNSGDVNLDVPAYVKNIFMGNDASDSIQRTNSFLRSRVGIMARGD